MFQAELRRLKHRHRAVDIAQTLPLSDQSAVKVVGSVFGEGAAVTNFLVAGGWEPLHGPRVRQAGGLGQVGEGHDVANVEYLVAVVSDPDLDILQVEQGVDLRQVG